MIAITYARSRLWLGISGVGLIVVVSSYLLASGLPLGWLPDDPSWSGQDPVGLVAMIGCLVGMMFPLDLLGGFLLPNRSRPGTIAFGPFIKGWIRGALVQASFFLLASLVILTVGRAFGLVGVCLAILVMGLAGLRFNSASLG